MRIVYSLGKRHSANFQALDFLRATNGLAIVKIAAYVSCVDGYLPKIDLNLDAVSYDKKNISLIYNEIEKFDPDLIIVDGETILASLANMMNIELWSLSSLHILDGVILENGQKSKYKHLVSYTRKVLQNIKANRKFVYSPFGDLYAEPPLRDGYEWVSPRLPYKVINKATAILTDSTRKAKLARIISNLDNRFEFCDFGCVSENSVVFSLGESAIIANALKNNNYVLVAPNVSNDAESVINSMIINEYGLGNDLGQIEFMDKYAVQIINKLTTSIVKHSVKFGKENKKIEDILKEKQNACSI